MLLPASVEDICQHKLTCIDLQGFRLVLAQDCWHKSLVPLMDEVRQQMGSGPVYISFDIDGLDPAFAPGTGKRIT